ncbi:MAG: cysteine dioxygenase family protein [Burkholderiaceae bacterium]|nr:cysteine dioxygenase family protein [Burkholderiaceae bacterium]
MAVLQARNPRVSLHYAVANQKDALFPVKGQGTVSVTPSIVDNTLRFVLSSAEGNLLEVAISSESFHIYCKANGATTTLAQSQDAALLLNQPGVELPYWVSLDSNNQRVRYGKGEMLRDLMLFEFSWAGKDDCPLNAVSKEIRDIAIQGARIDHIKVLEIPVTLTPSPHIIPSSAITMETIAANSASVIDDLPSVCQRLYANVAGPGINLNPPDFPEFAQAIQYSIVTPGALCYNKLAEKDPIFGYLRVTLDSNMGDSPGQPYVLEIWPAGNGSPIHDHGEACAVIKVLHGQIKVSWFSALTPSIDQPWGSTIAHAGEVTFLTPDYYQIHQLQNPSPKAGGDFCATIQCYRYPDDDLQHYEYFDYIEDGEIKQFLPDSDWGYLEFKQAIQEEWKQVMAQQ